MGKAWDNGAVAFDPATWEQALRVLKPGGHLLAFGGTRTFHRLTCAVEDAGFEIRDCLMWLYGSGFPKSLDVSKAIDKAEGAEREVVGVGRPVKRMIPGADQDRTGSWIKDNGREFVPSTSRPATPEAAAWEGWGTALKPAWEPIIMARKSLRGTVAGNVRRYGTGAVNIDASRIGSSVGGERAGERAGEPSAERRYAGRGSTTFSLLPGPRGGDALGRWPANIALDEAAAALLDEQSGERGGSGKASGPSLRGVHGSVALGVYNGLPDEREPAFYGDRGGASRFFYVAKADSEERSRGLSWRNQHPTVKPVSLMSWLVRMVTPPGGTVLDPFLGSGTTAIAAIGCGFNWIGIEREAEYVELARQRIGLFSA